MAAMPLVTGGEHVFHDGVEIWKDPKGMGQQVPQARGTGCELTAGNMVDAGGGHELVGDREIALVEDFFDHAAGADPQVFRDMPPSLRPGEPGRQNERSPGTPLVGHAGLAADG
jgi:hypothetical protein